MQKHLLYMNLFALSSALALTACSDEVTDALTPDLPIEEKTPIELSMGGVDSPNAATRAVITDGTNKPLKPFEVNTKIFMVMKSEYDTGNPDFAGTRTTKYNVARGDVSVSKNDDTNKWSIVDFDAKNQRYWDDAHARSTMLSIYAYAQQGQSTWNNVTFNGNEYKTEADATQPYAWTTTEIVPTILTWRASHQQGTEAQNSTSVLAQDLLFSNNLANNGTGKDKRLKFDFSTRKFPKLGEANMIFYHAMSKIIVKIVEGDGFDKSATTDFQFTTVTTSTDKNLILKGFNHTGKFDIAQGEFTEIASNGKTDIPSICLSSTTPEASVYYTLEALAIPSIANNGKSRFVKDAKNLTNDVMIEFSIDNNKFQITSDQLYNALHEEGNPSNGLVDNAVEKSDNGNYIPLEAGKKYIFTFTVGKTKIKNITAQVAEWETVEADNVNPSNARIKLKLEERGKPQTTDVAFYKAEDNNTGDIDDNYAVYNWKTGYTNMNARYPDGGSHWTTNLFWESNKDFYHFRALMPDETVVKTDATNGDYVTLMSASCTNEDGYNQIAWGAPMLDDADDEIASTTLKWNYEPTKYGFDGKISDVEANPAKHQISKAIGPTEDPVKLILFHMMSGVHFSIKTTSDDAKVQLSKSNGGDPETFTKTRVDLVGYYKDGKVLLGTGLVKTAEAISDSENPYNIGFASAEDKTDYVDQEYFFSAVPQDLTAVKLYITTPDNNQYIVDLKDVTVTGSKVSNHNIVNPYATSGKIDRWYPGFKYVYSFTLKKTGITDLTATIVEWETVTAENEDVEIK